MPPPVKSHHIQLIRNHPCNHSVDLFVHWQISLRRLSSTSYRKLNKALWCCLLKWDLDNFHIQVKNTFLLTLLGIQNCTHKQSFLVKLARHSISHFCWLYCLKKRNFLSVLKKQPLLFGSYFRKSYEVVTVFGLIAINKFCPGEIEMKSSNGDNSYGECNCKRNPVAKVLFDCKKDFQALFFCWRVSFRWLKSHE